jgi:hypothetical protein
MNFCLPSTWKSNLMWPPSIRSILCLLMPACVPAAFSVAKLLLELVPTTLMSSFCAAVARRPAISPRIMLRWMMAALVSSVVWT